MMGATWTKDGDPFDQATAPDRRVSLNSTGITIDPVRPQDEGVYRCNNGTPLELTSALTCIMELFVIYILAAKPLILILLTPIIIIYWSQEYIYIRT